MLLTIFKPREICFIQGNEVSFGEVACPCRHIAFTPNFLGNTHKQESRRDPISMFLKWIQLTTFAIMKSGSGQPLS